MHKLLQGLVNLEAARKLMYAFIESIYPKVVIPMTPLSLKKKKKNDDFLNMLQKVSSTYALDDQKKSAKKLRQLTENTPSIRAKFAESDDVVEHLLTALSQTSYLNYGLNEDIIATITNLCLNDNNIGSRVLAMYFGVEHLIFNTLEGPPKAYACMQCKAAGAATLSSMCPNDISKE